MGVTKWLVKSEKLRPFFASFWSTLVSSAIISLGGIFCTLGLRDTNNIQWGLLVCGGLSLGFGWLLAHVTKKSESQAKVDSQRELSGARRKAVASFNGRLGHVYTLLLKVVDPDTRNGNLEAYIQALMGSSVSLFDVDEVRACLYILDGSVTVADSDKPNVLVHKEPHCGRADPPRMEFRQNTAHGGMLFDVLSTRVPLHVADTSTSSRPIDANQKIYKSFVAVAIYSGNTELGVLTLDAVEANAISSEHVVTAQTLASLLAIGLYLSAPGRSVIPTRTRP